MTVIEIKSPQELSRLRRLALAAQGLLQNKPYGRGLAGARKAINHLGYVQIDTISVVERAHHHVIHSRVPGFEPHMLNQLLINKDIFEYWSHAAAFLPITDFRFSLPYKNAIKSGQTHWFRSPDKKLMGELLARIRSDGPPLCQPCCPVGDIA
ncbi:DNA glycosylase AlkZ-like family protein [Vreelandella titanicae]|uniref:DNA glycosylase AlkZ-like family protein n=1 Tax=Vreelandella titanicae TaxID=664683 RepID=UPI003D0252E3